MIPAPFDYHRPGTLDEAIGLLSHYGSDAKVLSGGMSLLPALKLRLGSYGHLVDIGRIPGLEYIKEDRGVVCIGAGTRQSTLTRSEIIASRYGVLADAVPMIADPLVRNRATREPLVPYNAAGPATAPMTEVMAACRAKGVWPFIHFNRLHVVPPCTISPDEARLGIGILDEVLAVADAHVTG